MRRYKNVLPAHVNSVVVLIFSAAVKGLCVLPTIEINMMLVVRTCISRGFCSVISLFSAAGEELGEGEGVGRGLVEMRSPKLGGHWQWR